MFTLRRVRPCSCQSPDSRRRRCRRTTSICNGWRKATCHRASSHDRGRERGRRRRELVKLMAFKWCAGLSKNWGDKQRPNNPTDDTIGTHGICWLYARPITTIINVLRRSAQTRRRRHWRIQVRPRLMHENFSLLSQKNRGIGLAVTTTLLEEFNAVVVAIARTRTPELVALLDKHPADLLTITADVCVHVCVRVGIHVSVFFYSVDETAIRDAMSLCVTTYEHIDGLVLNAAVLEPIGRIDSPANTADSWRSHFDVNFFSLLYTLQAALPALRQSELGGRVVFVSSGSAVGGMPGWGAYNASKAAMNSLCR